MHILGYHRLFLAMNLSEWGSLSGSHFGMVKVIVSLRFEIHHSTAYNGSISAFGYYAKMNIIWHIGQADYLEVLKGHQYICVANRSLSINNFPCSIFKKAKIGIPRYRFIFFFFLMFKQNIFLYTVRR